MDEMWYKNAIFYAIDVKSFQDSNGDGIGDLPGVVSRLDYLADLGVNCLWLLPFYPSPFRDNGYDVIDHFNIDPRFGTFEDLDALVKEANQRGMRIILDLVRNHTSDQHPWFQAARRDRDSRFWHYYIWEDEPPEDPEQEPMFPDVEDSVWQYDEKANAYYYHTFYRFQPCLEVAHPHVREELCHIADFWLAFGVDGFRMDAVPHMIHQKGLDSNVMTDPYDLLGELQAYLIGRNPEAVLLGEVNVSVDEIMDYFGNGDRHHLIFNFQLNQHLFLALAREDATPIVEIMEELPTVPAVGQWANFLRNHDELNLGHLNDEERAEILDRFAPDEDMRIFGRGSRQRLASMLGGNQDLIRMAYSLLFAMPGSPTLLYGDEIGMGENLALEGRNSVRTPMQWSADNHAGFSSVEPDDLARSLVEDGPFGYHHLNVAGEQDDPDSLLNWMKTLIKARKEYPVLGCGHCQTITADEAQVLATRTELGDDAMITLHNVGPQPRKVQINLKHTNQLSLEPVFGNAEWCEIEGEHATVQLPGYGYQWYRVNEE
jgi:maltose alpha-D-glucosyltransferase / alpha-amylase